MMDINQILESVIDPAQPTVADAVFDERQQLRIDVRFEILRVWALINDLVTTGRVLIVGGIATYNYSERSDIDVTIQVMESDKTNIDKAKALARSQNGQYLAGTHEINYFLRESIPWDNYNGIYDVIAQEWIKGPSDVGVNVDSYMAEFERVVNNIDTQTAELLEDLVEYRHLRGMSGKSLSKASSIAQTKLQEIQQDVNGLSDEYRVIVQARQGVFENPNPAELQKYGDKAALPENVIYLLLRRYCYLHFLNAIKNAKNTDGATVGDVQQAYGQFDRCDESFENKLGAVLGESSNFVQTLDGEFWFDEDGFATACDGDVGSVNHEMVIVRHAMSDLIDLLEEDDKLNHLVGLLRYYIEDDGVDVVAARCAVLDWADSAQKEGMLTPEEADDIVDTVIKRTGVDPLLVNVAFGNVDDAREYGLVNLGWIRVQGNNIQTHDLTDRKLGLVEVGLDRAYSGYDIDFDRQAFTVEDLKTNEVFRGVPFPYLAGATVVQLRKLKRSGIIEAKEPTDFDKIFDSLGDEPVSDEDEFSRDANRRAMTEHVADVLNQRGITVNQYHGSYGTGYSYFDREQGSTPVTSEVFSLPGVVGQFNINEPDNLNNSQHAAIIKYHEQPYDVPIIIDVGSSSSFQHDQDNVILYHTLCFVIHNKEWYPYCVTLSEPEISNICRNLKTSWVRDSSKGPATGH